MSQALQRIEQTREALVEALLFRSTSDIPVSTHALTLQITNAASETSAPVTVAVQFTADILNGTGTLYKKPGYAPTS